MATYKYINPGFAHNNLDWAVNEYTPNDTTKTLTGYCFSTTRESPLDYYSQINLTSGAVPFYSVYFSKIYGMFDVYLQQPSTDVSMMQIQIRSNGPCIGFKFASNQIYLFTPNNTDGVYVGNRVSFNTRHRVYFQFLSSSDAQTENGKILVKIDDNEIINTTHKISFSYGHDQHLFAYVLKGNYLSHLIFSDHYFSPREEIFEVPIDSTKTSFIKGVNFYVAPYVQDFIAQKPNANQIKAISPAHSKITGYSIAAFPAYRNGGTPSYLQPMTVNQKFLLDDVNRKWHIKGNPSFHMFGRTGSCINTSNGFIFNNSDSILYCGTSGWMFEWFEKVDSVPNTEQKIICGENNCQIAYSIDIHYDGVNPEPRVSIGDPTLDKWCINNVPIGNSVLNKWVLRCVERYGDTIYCFQNGALTAQYSLPNSSQVIRKPSHWFIGGCFRDPEFHFNGFISQVFFSNSPRTPANYRVHEHELRRLNTAEGSLHFETTHGNSYPFLTDSKNNVWRSKGNPLPCVAEDGTRALRLHRSSIYTDKGLLSLGTEDFTIEWYDFRQGNPSETWYSFALTIANLPYQVYGNNKHFQIGNSEQVTLWLRNSANQTKENVVNAGYARSGWCHRAFSRSGNYIYGFENGHLVSKTDLSTIGYTNIKPGKYTIIGYGDDNDQYPQYGNNYIYLTDFRITDKFCRYTNDFNPPAMGSLTADEHTTSILTFGSDLDSTNVNPVINSLSKSVNFYDSRQLSDKSDGGALYSCSVEQSIDDFSENSYGWKVSS